MDNKLLEEIVAYRRILNYINEQEALPPLPETPLPAQPVTPPAEVSPIPPATEPQPTEPQPIDVAQDDSVTEIDAEGVSMEEETPDVEELDITDLVDAQTKIQEKQDEYFNNLFGQIKRMEEKLSEMDRVMSKLDSLEAKVEKYRKKTPEEKLELRSLDSGPFTQKLSDFFDVKQDEMKKSGKNEYVLTSDEVNDINPREIQDTFNDYLDDEEEEIIEI